MGSLIQYEITYIEDGFNYKEEYIFERFENKFGVSTL